MKHVREIDANDMFMSFSWKEMGRLFKLEGLGREHMSELVMVTKFTFDPNNNLIRRELGSGGRNTTFQTTSQISAYPEKKHQNQSASLKLKKLKKNKKH